jgi:hypothetical protein
MADGSVLTKAQWELQRQEAMSTMPDLVAKIGKTKALLPYQQGVVG